MPWTNITVFFLHIDGGFAPVKEFCGDMGDKFCCFFPLSVRGVGEFVGVGPIKNVID